KSSLTFGGTRDQQPLLHVQSQWLERCLNIIIVRTGFRTMIEAHQVQMAKRAKLSKVDRDALEEADRKAAAATSTAAHHQHHPHSNPSVAFLPPTLSVLVTHPQAYFCAQGVLRDIVRHSDRLRAM